MRGINLLVYAYSLINIVGFYFLIENMKFTISMKGHPVKFEIYTLSFMLLGILLFYYLISKHFKRSKILKARKNKDYEVNDLFMFVILIGYFLFSFKTRVGFPTNIGKSSFAFLIVIFDVNQWVLLYYLMNRRRKKALFWINIAIYTLGRSYMGWSGHYFSLFLFEIIYLISRIKKIPYMKLSFYAGLLAVSYNTLDNIKYKIRYGTSYKYQDLGFMKLLEKFSNRISVYENFVCLTQFRKEVSQTLISVNGPFEYLKEFLKIIFRQNYNLLSMGNLLASGLRKNKLIASSNNTGFLSRVIIYSTNSILEGIIYIFFVILLFFIMEKTLYLLNTRKVIIYYCYTVLNFVLSGDTNKLIYNVVSCITFLFVIKFFERLRKAYLGN